MVTEGKFTLLYECGNTERRGGKYEMFSDGPVFKNEDTHTP